MRLLQKRQENEKRIFDGRMTFNTEINDCRESGDFIFSYPLSMIIFSAWRGEHYSMINKTLWKIV